MIENIRKENGKLEKYSLEKASLSIYNTMSECKECRANKTTAKKLAKKIEASLEPIVEQGREVTTNDWAEAAISVLKEYSKELSDQYKDTRVKKQLNRLKNSSLMKSFNDILGRCGDDPNSVNTENANIDGFNPAAQLHRIGSETNKAYVLDYILSDNMAKAHREKWLHIHDLDYFELNPNCLQIDLKEMLDGGFSTGTGINSEPKSILTASMLSAIVLQSSTNNMHGGQSLMNLDYALEKYVNISYRKYFKSNIENFYDVSSREKPKFITDALVKKLYYGITIDDIIEGKEMYLDESEDKATKAKLSIIEKFLAVANKETERETNQAMQALCHNLSTLHSRAADQVPFSSVNFGLCTSEAGRLVSKCLLENIIHGSGHGETFIYPIAIFHVLEGINYFPSDKNYDLLSLAMKASSKRFYPNYVFCDSPFQYQFLRNKQGKLLWKAREAWHIEQGHVTKEELDALPDGGYAFTNTLNRIRKVAEIDRSFRGSRNKDKAFDVKAFMEGTTSAEAVEKAHQMGYELPVAVDSLGVGFDDRTTPARMGCRTYVESDVFAKYSQNEEPKTFKFKRGERPPYAYTAGRGNFNFVTMNLPKFAIDALKNVKGAQLEKKNPKDIEEKAVSNFYKNLMQYMVLAMDILRLRQEVISKKPARNFRYIVGENAVLGSKGMDANEETRELWKHFSKSIGFIGLYETMFLLYKKKQLDVLDEEVAVINFMRNVTEGFTHGYYVLPTEIGLEDDHWFESAYDISKSEFCHACPVKSEWDIKFQAYDIDHNPIFFKDNPELKIDNWSVFATPAEGSCMSFYNADLKEYGKIKNVTDKGYYTNSNHIDVREKVTVSEKAAAEGIFHSLATAGDIFYIETDGFIGKNIKAYKEILKIMHDNEIGYAAVNMPNDYCDVCHYQGVIPEGEGCPHCGNKDEDSIVRIRRITGYLTGSTSKWNAGKRAELKNRVSHTS